VSLLATLHKNFRTDLHEIFRERWQWANKRRLNFGGDPDWITDQHLDRSAVFA